MSYNVVQKIRNNYYLYEVTSEWNPETKSSRQKRKYIGKCDEKGNLLASGETEVISKNMGEYYLMHNVCRRIGLWDAMCKIYGEETTQHLFSYSIGRCLRNCLPMQTTYSTKASILPDFFGFPVDSKLLTLEGCFKVLMSAYQDRVKLFDTFSPGGDSIVFDIETMIPPLKYYKLFGKENHFRFNEFPQKSIFLAIDETSRLPYYFRMAQYSGADAVSMKTVCDDLKDMRAKNVTFFLNDKSYKESQIGHFLGPGYDTIIILNSGSEFFTKMMFACTDMNVFETMIYDETVYKYHTLEWEFGLNRCKVTILDNTRDREEALISFYTKLEQFESTVSKLKWSKTLEKRLEDNYGLVDLRRFFKLERGEDGSVVVTRNLDEIYRMEYSFGKSVVVTNSEYGLKDILRISRNMDRFEQDVNIFRTDLQEGSGLFPSNEMALASFMGEFVSMIMKTALINLVEVSGLREEMNYLDVISEASTMKSYWVNGTYSVTRATPALKEMFEKLGMSPPTAAMRTKNRPPR